MTDISDDAILEAERLRDQALKDKIKDTKREARIAKLEAGDDLLNEVKHDISQGSVRGDGYDDRRDKAKPAKLEPGWYSKTDQTQRRALQKVTGSYRPEPGDPVSQKARGAAVREGRLWDPHPLSRVRKLDVEASNAIKADVPTPNPVRPVDPGPAEQPIPGCCWWCYTPLRKRDRKGTRFCTDNMGDCRTAWNEHQSERVAQLAAYEAYSDSLLADRMFSIHCAAAEAMYLSAIRCGGVDATLMATGDGVLATHAAPLPPFNPQVLVKVECAGGTLHVFQFGTQRIYGHALLDVTIVAKPVAAGTLFTFEMDRPEGIAMAFYFNFEGDPGPEWRTHQDPIPPFMNGSYAARNGRAAEYVKSAKTANLCSNTSVS